ncbi:MAG: hypothetical protein HY791_35525 [Deltaproteobacteria bacterium]|nr:hypothetical protein [Deltaproteobacteria bacterium]
MSRRSSGLVGVNPFARRARLEVGLSRLGLMAAQIFLLFGLAVPLGCGNSPIVRFEFGEPALLVAVDEDVAHVVREVYRGDGALMLTASPGTTLITLPLSGFRAPDGSVVQLSRLAEAEVSLEGAPLPSGSCGRCTTPSGSKTQLITAGDRCPVPRFAEASEVRANGLEAISLERLGELRAKIVLDWPGECGCLTSDAHPEPPSLEWCELDLTRVEVATASIESDGTFVGVNRSHLILAAPGTEGEVLEFEEPYLSPPGLIRLIGTSTDPVLAVLDPFGQLSVERLRRHGESIGRAIQPGPPDFSAESIQITAGGEFRASGHVGGRPSIQLCTVGDGLSCVEEELCPSLGPTESVRSLGTLEGAPAAYSSSGRVLVRSAEGWRCLDTTHPPRVQLTPALEASWESLRLVSGQWVDGLIEGASGSVFVCMEGTTPRGPATAVMRASMDTAQPRFEWVGGAEEGNCRLVVVPGAIPRVVAWFERSPSSELRLFEADGRALESSELFLGEAEAPQQLTDFASAPTGWLAVRNPGGTWRRRAPTGVWARTVARSPNELATEPLNVIASGARIVAFFGRIQPMELVGRGCESALVPMDFPAGRAGDRALDVAVMEDGRHLVSGTDLSGSGWLRLYDLETGAFEEGRGLNALPITDVAKLGLGAVLLDSAGALWRWSGGPLLIERIRTEATFESLSSAGGVAWMGGRNALARLPEGESEPELEWLEGLRRDAFDQDPRDSAATLLELAAVCSDRVLVGSSEELAAPNRHRTDQTSLWWLGAPGCGAGWEGLGLCGFDFVRDGEAPRSFESLVAVAHDNPPLMVFRSDTSEDGSVVSRGPGSTLVPFLPTGIGSDGQRFLVGGRRLRAAAGSKN